MRGRRWFVALWLTWGVLGCQSIAGIEERRYDPASSGTGGSGSRPPATEGCRKYCAAVVENCTGKQQMYANVDGCLGVCSLLDPGDPLEPAGNTLACRATQAKLAGTTGEPAVHCPQAGPGGGGACGTACESYCALVDRACSLEFSTQAECVEKCATLPDATPFDANVLQGNSLTCRLVHLSAASLDPTLHCPHVGVLPADYCVEPAGDAPSCDEYCRVVMKSCMDENAVYESPEQCQAACAGLDPGMNGDRAVNTIGCRQYHAYAALLDPAVHCAHAGPTGDGYCGADTAHETGNCTSYCSLLLASCEADFGAAFSGLVACMAACGKLSGAAAASGYSVARAEQGKNLQCRVLHALRAATDPSACAGALGGSPCDAD